MARKEHKRSEVAKVNNFEIKNRTSINQLTLILFYLN